MQLRLERLRGLWSSNIGFRNCCRRALLSSAVDGEGDDAADDDDDEEWDQCAE